MYGRSRFQTWAVVFCVLAVFAAEPRASLSFTVEAFQAIGDFGGTLIVEVLEDDPSVAAGETDR